MTTGLRGQSRRARLRDTGCWLSVIQPVEWQGETVSRGGPVPALAHGAVLLPAWETRGVAMQQPFIKQLLHSGPHASPFQ